MKIICDRPSLFSVIGAVSGVVKARDIQPALSCVKFEAFKDANGAGSARVSATGGEVSLSMALTAVDVQRPGIAIVPAEKFRAIVGLETATPTLTMETDKDDKLTIRGSDSSYEIYGYPPKNFPALPDYAAALAGKGEAVKTTFEIPAAELDRLVVRTLFATSKETSRYACAGVLMRSGGKKLEFVSCDERRMSICRYQLSSKASDAHCIVPAGAMSMVRKLIVEPDEKVSVLITDSRAYFAFGSDRRSTMSSLLVEATFPPYEDAVPKGQDRKIGVNRADLLDAMMRASVLTNEESRGVQMAFVAESKSLKLSSRAPENGQSEVGAKLDSYEGADINIAFNPKFIADFLAATTDELVTVELKKPSGPAVFRAGADFLYVVMPVNLPE